MSNYYLAIDIGASSGRHVLGCCENGKMVMEEIHRFSNGMTMRGGHLCWDTEALFGEILTGMKKCKEIGKIPVSMGIDTWAVDFVLLDGENQVIGDTVGYRDSRTDGMDGKVYDVISEGALYARTGIQKQIFNSIYQLKAIQVNQSQNLQKAKSLLMLPDYFHFLLTGNRKTEYTNATTTQLVNPATKDWDYELMDMLGYPKEIFQKIVPAGTVLGELMKGIQKEVGFNCKVVLPATHDTGSAVLAVPAVSKAAAKASIDAQANSITATNDNRSMKSSDDMDSTMYISSGTWSLMGVERMEADCSAASRALNFTNEGGYNYRYRYLKNIMGLWMIQSLRHELDDKYSFAELCDMAETSSISSIVDCNDASFLAPESMREAVKNYCAQSGQEVPQTPADEAHVIYNSLAKCYGDTAAEIEAQMGRTYDTLHVVGGGANADYLNQLTANATGKEVLAGPTEATAIGNLAVQMLTAGEYSGLGEARSAIRESFPIKVFVPQD